MNVLINDTTKGMKCMIFAFLHLNSSFLLLTEKNSFLSSLAIT